MPSVCADSSNDSNDGEEYSDGTEKAENDLRTLIFSAPNGNHSAPLGKSEYRSPQRATSGIFCNLAKLITC